MEKCGVKIKEVVVGRESGGSSGDCDDGDGFVCERGKGRVIGHDSSFNAFVFLLFDVIE